MDGFYNADLKNIGQFLFSFVLINKFKTGGKGRRKKPIKKLFASLYSAPARSRATQYVSTPSPSSIAVTDMDRHKPTLYTVLGLLGGLMIIIIPITFVIKFWYRRKYKPPASGKKTNCARSQISYPTTCS